MGTFLSEFEAWAPAARSERRVADVELFFSHICVRVCERELESVSVCLSVCLSLSVV